MSDLPLVTIVTPSFNQALYLEETINSVLEQDYSNVEYIIVDGGSTDGSLEIIKKYADKLAWWVSEPDEGQADAINKGVAKANGEFIAWLNSDDLYMPNAISQAVDNLMDDPSLGMVYGKLHSIDSDGKVFNTITYRQFRLKDLLAFYIIGQPTVFMRRSVLKKTGILDTSFHYLLDHHLWLRMIRSAKIKYVPKVWAAARHHPSAKNVAQASNFGQEAFRILEWAQTQPDLKETIDRSPRRIWAGVHRLDARYLLDGGRPGLSLGAYLKTFFNLPSFAYQNWHRIFFAILSLVGLGFLYPVIARRRKFFRTIDNTFGTDLSDITNLSSRLAIRSRPILVTGPHRSGTTWVGKMLSAGGSMAYVSEPLNILHRYGVLRVPVQQWYKYICAENEGEYIDAFRETLQLDYHSWGEIKSLRSIKDILRMARDWGIFNYGKLFNRRVLLKDPFAVFSAPWFSQRLGCQIVIVVRHPAAFVSSLKRLDWPFDFQDMLDQPLLMRDWLEPFRSDMEALVDSPDDVIGQGSLLWRMIYYVVNEYRGRYPSFQVVHHEDLSIEPLEGFSSLFRYSGLSFTPRAQDRVIRATRPENPGEISLASIYSVNLDSRANLKNWQRRLTGDEILRIRELTTDVAGKFYSDEDWD